MQTVAVSFRTYKPACPVTPPTGTDTQRIFVVNIKRKTATIDNILVTDHKGRIFYTTSTLAATLGYSLKQMKKLELSRLMPMPFSHLHDAWLKVRMCDD